MRNTYNTHHTPPAPQVFIYQHDLPDDVDLGNSVAIDTETMGLNHHRDRLCLVQMSSGNNVCHMVQIHKEKKASPNLERMLADNNVEKIFHFARFDIASLYQGLGVMCAGSIYCTKIASRLTRTYTDYHGLKSLCRDLLGVDLSKAQQTSDWGAKILTDQQKHYAASDVIHLHALKKKLHILLEREGRAELFQTMCAFLCTRVQLDLAGFPEEIFAH